jgi:hypothetical protein
VYVEQVPDEQVVVPVAPMNEYPDGSWRSKLQEGDIDMSYVVPSPRNVDGVGLHPKIVTACSEPP